MKQKKILYFLNHQTFFCSHFLNHALKARNNNFQIFLLSGKDSSRSSSIYNKKILKKKKIKYKKINLNSTKLEVINDFLLLFQYIKIIKELKPDIIHVVTLKAQLITMICSFFLKVNYYVIYISGIGSLFSEKSTITELFIKKIIHIVRKFFFNIKKFHLIVENNHDLSFFKKNYYIKNKNITRVNGLGVNLKKIKKIKNYKKNKIILMPSRVLLEKGIMEFVNASKILKKKYNFQFYIAGAIDYEKKSKINKSLIKKINKGKYCFFLGHVNNIEKLFLKSAIICLPSYREGFSKSISEAVAYGIPVVTTSVVGCKDVIKNNKNGLLAKKGNYISLKNKLEYLIQNPNVRYSMRKYSLKFERKKFDINLISRQIIKVYTNFFHNLNSQKLR